MILWAQAFYMASRGSRGEHTAFLHSLWNLYKNGCAFRNSCCQILVNVGVSPKTCDTCIWHMYRRFVITDIAEERQARESQRQKVKALNDRNLHTQKIQLPLLLPVANRWRNYYILLGWSGSSKISFIFKGKWLPSFLKFWKSALCRPSSKHLP